MTLELRFFHACDHMTKSEPLILDQNGIGQTAWPMANSVIRIIEENVEIIREPIIRTANSDVDALTGPLVTDIDLVVQEIKYKGSIEKRKFQHGRDYILTSERLILWKSTGLHAPIPGKLYYVNYRIARLMPKNYRVLNSHTLKLGVFDQSRSYVIDYLTTPEYCTKCQKTVNIDSGFEQPNVVQDIDYGPTGDFKLIQGVDKLKQDVIRAVMAAQGSNPREPFYGTSIEASVGTAQVSTVFESVVAQEIRNSLMLLKTIHEVQARVQPGVDPSEILSNVVRVQVLSDQERVRARPLGGVVFDPTLYTISVVVESAANSLVDLVVPLDVFSRALNPADIPTIEVTELKINNITQNSAIITWRTNIDTDSIVDFGETNDLSSRESSESGLRHLVTLSGLKPDTVYYFKIVTRNRGFVFGASLKNFKTIA